MALVEKRTGMNCLNYGIGGTRIARQQSPSACERWDLDFCSRVMEMQDEADFIFVFGGTNDFGHGDAPLGTFSDRTPDSFYGALHCLYQSLLVKYPKSRIIVMTPLHRQNEDNPKGDGGKTTDVAVLKTYVQIIRLVAEYYSLPVLDLFANSGLQPVVEVMNKEYFVDGLHPNDLGHSTIADCIISYLQTL